MNLSLEKIFFFLFRFKKTYSQCGEDVIIKHVLNILGKKKNIRYLDIGTNHPKITNNTYLFYTKENSGVCIEPNSSLCKKIKNSRPRDICLNAGIGTTNINEMNFYSMSVDTLSTFSEMDARKLDQEGIYKIREIVKVPVFTYNEIINTYFSNGIDLVSIDVEDLNEEIVSSLTFNVRPAVFCIETVVFSSSTQFSKLTSIIEKLESNGYMIYADTFVNTIFVDKRCWENKK